ncbi:MAG: metallophosphoesterase family protein [Candidatus Aenigmarchaeota archaeon]|nr:metallophosphoesterase family protein [Candidatus Aenigmarchaeota archaeon]
MANAGAVEIFFKKGRLLTPEALRYLENKNAENFLSESSDLVVDVEDLLAREDKIHIIRNITGKKSEVTTADIVRFYNSKYEKMKNIILSRMQKNFISINKLDTQRSEVCVIGIVRDIKGNEGKKNIELEDSTGSVTVVFEPNLIEDLELDDVVAVQGIAAGKVMFGKKILFPDVPLRQPTKGSGKACFISDLHLDEAPKQDLEKFLRWLEGQDTRYLFVVGDIGDINIFEYLVDAYCRDKKVFVAMGKDAEEMPGFPSELKSKNVIALSNPALVEINGIKILVINNFDIKMLRKRHLGNIKPILEEDFMALEELPDIVHCGHSHEASINNYKSTTIINAGSLLTNFRPVIVDFATRECMQVDVAGL